MTGEEPSQGGLLAWFASNSVAANLLLLLIAVGGLITVAAIPREVFPEIDIDVITVTVAYPGAAPEETEEAICVRIEEQLHGVDGIDRLRSSGIEGVGLVTVELQAGADPRRVLDDIKARVDAIDTFPEEAEKPVIQQLVYRQNVLAVAVAGDADEGTLKSIGQRVRDDIAALPGITHADLTLARDYEISIETSEDALRRYGLTFAQVAEAVRRTSLDLPGGSIKSESGEILLRTKGQAYRRPDFEKLVLLSRPDGTRLTLGDVATVVDGFAETDQRARFDGKPAVLVKVYRVGEQSALHISNVVREYMDSARLWTPEGIELILWDDDAEILRSRLDTLLHNGRDGFILVLILLALFLRLRVAFWVMAGVPLCFLGTLWLMPVFDTTINVISLFAFILVLGILVDDAIVIGENIYTYQQRGVPRLQAAILGAREVAVPVAFGVLTTVAAFLPGLWIPGPMGKFLINIPICVILALLFSLLESTLILPAHLAHGGSADDAPRTRIGKAWGGVQNVVARGLSAFIEKVYRPALAVVLEWRYLSVASGIVALLLTVGLVGGHWVQLNFFPSVEADNIVAYLTMPQGTPARVTAEGVRQLEASAQALAQLLEQEQGAPVVRHIMASVGEQPYKTQQERGGFNFGIGEPHLGEVNVALVPSEERKVTSAEVLRRWRESTAAIPGAAELVFNASLISSGEDINIQLQGSSIADLKRAAERLKDHLAEFPGVVDLTDSFQEGKRELVLRILPSAEALGLTMADLGRQVRQAFYGEEVQRIQRGRDEVKVMVRYPAAERRSLADIENMRVRTPQGIEVPFRAVAAMEMGRGYATIRRTDRQRVINVTANVDDKIANANDILATVTSSFLPQLRGDFHGLSYSLEGEQRQQQRTIDAMARGFVLSLFGIYALLAIPLRSYLQPLIIMSAIPFGLVGAVWGHFLLGWEISMFSMFGLVALTGVVVNDSLVMVSYVNQHRDEGMSLHAAIREAGAARFRPILLTSLTTFAGLVPLILERSVQAQILIPMALSLAFGVLFATLITLFLVPAIYLIIEDIQRLAGAAISSRHRQVASPKSQVPSLP